MGRYRDELNVDPRSYEMRDCARSKNLGHKKKSSSCVDTDVARHCPNDNDGAKSEHDP